MKYLLAKLLIACDKYVHHLQCNSNQGTDLEQSDIMTSNNVRDALCGDTPYVQYVWFSLVDEMGIVKEDVMNSASFSTIQSNAYAACCSMLSRALLNNVHFNNTSNVFDFVPSIETCSNRPLILDEREEGESLRDYFRDVAIQNGIVLN